MVSEQIRYLLCIGLSASCLSCQMGNSFSARSLATVRDNHHGYYLVLEETKQRELLQKVSQLKLGDSRREAINRLGPPTFDRADVTKEGGFIGRTVVYYLKIWEKDLVNEKHDSLVRLEFDTGDKLTKITKKVEDSQ